MKVKKEPELTFFSTGVLVRSTENMYGLTFTQDKLSEGYNFVVITEETVIDETPEVHILEGTAL